MFTTRTFCVYVSNPNLSCQFPSQSPFLWAFADAVHQNEKLIISSSFLNTLPEIQFFKKPPLFFWLEDNCFTILYWFLPYSNMNQPQIYMYSLSPEPPLISLPIHPSVLSHSTGLSSLCHTVKSHLVSLLHMAFYMFPCSSLNSSHHLLLPLCPQVCFLCLHLHCCPENLSV